MKIKSLEIPVRNLARVQEFFNVVLPEFVVCSVDKTLFAAMPEDLEVSFVETPSAIQGTGPIRRCPAAKPEGFTLICPVSALDLAHCDCERRGEAACRSGDGVTSAKKTFGVSRNRVMWSQT